MDKFSGFLSIRADAPRPAAPQALSVLPTEVWEEEEEEEGNINGRRKTQREEAEERVAGMRVFIGGEMRRRRGEPEDPTQ